MTQFSLKIDDLIFLDIVSAKIDKSVGEIEVILNHKDYELPILSAEMFFIDKRDENWTVYTDFWIPDYTSISDELKRRIEVWLKDIFSSILDSVLSKSENFFECSNNTQEYADLEEEIQQSLIGNVSME